MNRSRRELHLDRYVLAYGATEKIARLDDRGVKVLGTVAPAVVRDRRRKKHLTITMSAEYKALVIAVARDLRNRSK